MGDLEIACGGFVIFGGKPRTTVYREGAVLKALQVMVHVLDDLKEKLSMEIGLESAASGRGGRAGCYAYGVLKRR